MNPTNAEISISDSAPAGTFDIQIVGLIKSTGQKLSITVTFIGNENRPPYFIVRPP